MFIRLMDAESAGTNLEKEKSYLTRDKPNLSRITVDYNNNKERIECHAQTPQQT